MAAVMIASAIATKCHNGGNAAAVLNWVHGFQKLGLQTYVVEQIARQHCTDDHGRVVPFDQSANVAYFERVMREAKLETASALLCDAGKTTAGLPFREIVDIADSVDLLVNVTGHLTLEPLFRRLRRKVYLDLDPGYTQFWYASGEAGARLDGHDFYYTIGENIGTSACDIRRQASAGVTRASRSFSPTKTRSTSPRGRTGSRRLRVGAVRTDRFNTARPRSD